MLNNGWNSGYFFQVTIYFVRKLFLITIVIKKLYALGVNRKFVAEMLAHIGTIILAAVIVTAEDGIGDEVIVEEVVGNTGSIAWDWLLVDALMNSLDTGFSFSIDKEKVGVP